MSKSRLKNHLQKKAVQNILLALCGIIVIVALLFTFGTQLLINFSLLIEKLKGTSDTTTTSEDVSFVSPPTLNPMESYTKNAKITVSGYSLPKQMVKLYVNDELVEKTEVKEDKSFEFKDVSIKPGENDIKAKAVTENDKESNYSTSLKITYIDKPPTLEINSPSDGQTLSKDQGPYKVTGKTDPGNKVTVNDFWAIVDDEGKFTYTLPLQGGDNTIKIQVTDEADNKVEKEIKVKVE